MSTPTPPTPPTPSTATTSSPASSTPSTPPTPPTPSTTSVPSPASSTPSTPPTPSTATTSSPASSTPPTPPAPVSSNQNNLIRGITVYFLYLDSNKRQRAVRVAEKFGWARRIDVKDKNTYEFSVVSVTRPLTPVAPPPETSDSLDMNVDNGVVNYRFYIGPDIKSRISNDGVYSPTEDEPDWWLLSRPGMVPHQPVSQPRRNRRQSILDTVPQIDTIAAGIPKSAKVRFHKDATSSEIEEIEIQFFVN